MARQGLRSANLVRMRRIEGRIEHPRLPGLENNIVFVVPPTQRVHSKLSWSRSGLFTATVFIQLSFQSGGL